MISENVNNVILFLKDILNGDVESVETTISHTNFTLKFSIDQTFVIDSVDFMLSDFGFKYRKRETTGHFWYVSDNTFIRLVYVPERNILQVVYREVK